MDIRKRIITSLAAGIAGVILAAAIPDQIQNFVENRQEQTAVTAWWGTLYPKFCFSQMLGEDKGQKGDIKISLWLAQALDW